MALKSILIAIITAAAIAAPVYSTDYMVGDDSGWKTGFNYTVWAQGKDFHVGDRLIFKYTQGSHNVVRLSTPDDFRQCVVSGAATSLTTGNDVITLANPGKKWYICGVSDHCARGMRLAITVTPSEGLAPTPAPMATPGASSAANGFYGFMSFAWGLGALAAYKLIFAA